MLTLESVQQSFQELLAWQRILVFVGFVCVFYLLLLAVGRALKRRAGLQPGLSYQAAALGSGLYIALDLMAPALGGRREVAAIAIICGVHALLPLLTVGLLPWLFETKRHQPMPKFLREVVSLVVFVTTVLLVLQVDYDVQVPGLIAGSGIIAVAIGFAAQSVLGNILSGITLYISRPFHVNDWILIEHQHVQVVEINWRSSRFRTNDNIILDVPNSKITSETITNFSGIERHGLQHSRPHGQRLEVGIEYGAPPNRVRDILRDAAASASDVLDKPAADVFLKSFGDSSIVYEVRYWIENHHHYNQISDAVRTNIWYALRREGITIPFPIRTLQMERRKAVSTERHGHRHAEFRAMLQNQPIFRVIEGADLEYLLENCASHHYGRGEQIIVEQAGGDSMFVITSGQAAVLITGSGGTRSQVAELRKGDCFGEMSLLTGERRTATVQAMSDCEVLEITKPLFAEIVAREAGLLPQLSELLARRKLEMEGITTRGGVDGETTAADKESEYTETFLSRLKSFFEL